MNEVNDLLQTCSHVCEHKVLVEHFRLTFHNVKKYKCVNCVIDVANDAYESIL